MGYYNNTLTKIKVTNLLVCHFLRIFFVLYKFYYLPLIICFNSSFSAIRSSSWYDIIFYYIVFLLSCIYKKNYLWILLQLPNYISSKWTLLIKPFHLPKSTLDIHFTLCCYYYVSRSIYILIFFKEVILWKKVETNQQIAYFNKLSYGSLWKIIVLKS